MVERLSIIRSLLNKLARLTVFSTVKRASSFNRDLRARVDRQKFSYAVVRSCNGKKRNILSFSHFQNLIYFHIISRLMKWKVFWRIMWKCWLNVKANWMTWKKKPRIWKKAQWSKIKNSIRKLLGNTRVYFWSPLSCPFIGPNYFGYLCANCFRRVRFDLGGYKSFWSNANVSYTLKYLINETRDHLDEYSFIRLQCWAPSFDKS